MPSNMNLLIASGQGIKSPSYWSAQTAQNRLLEGTARSNLEDLPMDRAMKREALNSLILERQARTLELESQRAERIARIEERGIKEEKDLWEASRDLLPLTSEESWDDTAETLEKAAPRILKRGFIPRMAQIYGEAYKTGAEPMDIFNKVRSHFGRVVNEKLNEVSLLSLPSGHPQRENYLSGLEAKAKFTQKPEKVPSAGNAVDLAIKQKFGSDALTDPEKTRLADHWLSTPEGRAAVKENALALNPGTNVFIGQTPTGDVVTMQGKGSPRLSVTPGPEQGIGPKTMSEDYKKDVTAMGQARDLVNSLKTRWNSLGIGPGQEGRLQGSMIWAKIISGSHSTGKVYRDARKAFLGNLSRSVAAERGVLTNQDIERIADILPSIGPNAMSNDNKEEAAGKWGMIEEIISSADKRLKQRQTITPKTPTGTPAPTGETPVSRTDAFNKLKAKGKWTDKQINDFLDKEGIK